MQINSGCLAVGVPNVAKASDTTAFHCTAMRGALYQKIVKTSEQQPLFAMPSLCIDSFSNHANHRTSAYENT
jgi:hypothetical protein